MAKLRCLYGVKDDLHEYTEAVRERVGLGCISLRDFGKFTGAVFHRTGRFQAELLYIRPNETLPLHVHPGVDSIDLGLDGDALIQISGKTIAEGYSPERRLALLRSTGLRIAQDAPHGGYVGPHGFLFFSCQRWAGEPSHIGLAWAGAPCSDAHARLLEASGTLR